MVDLRRPILRPARAERRDLSAKRHRANVCRNDDGLTLVEVLVAFTALIVLFTISANVLTTYLNLGTSVTSSYSATDQLLPGSIIMQRLLRSQVEPAPTLTSTVTGVPAGYCANPTANVPCPAFPPSTVGVYSTTFYANIGDVNGPAKIVMAETTPTKCSGCKFPSATFTVTQYRAVASTCPFSATATNVCSWSATGTILVNIHNVVNGLSLNSSGTPILSTSLPTPLPEIFTYNTLDLNPTNQTPPAPAIYVPTAGGAASTTPASLPTGILAGFATCNAPNLNGEGEPILSNCPADIIQSVRVDLEVQFQGSPLQENSFTVYRLSSSSFLYSTLVG